MAYQLRSRKDPTVPETQEQTDIPVEHLAEIQVTTISQTMFVPPQLSDTEHEALPLAEASRTQLQTGLSISPQPEMLSNPQLDIIGPTRLDPGLGSAPASVGTFPPADTVGPPSTVMDSRDALPIGNRSLQLYETTDTSFSAFVHDSKEVKHTQQAGTTIYKLIEFLQLRCFLSCCSSHSICFCQKC